MTISGMRFASFPVFAGTKLVLDNDDRLGGLYRRTLVEVDFGFRDGLEDYTAYASVAAPWVTATTTIICSPAPVGTTDHDPLDAAVEGISAYAYRITPGVGFDLVATAANGTWGRYLISAVG